MTMFEVFAASYDGLQLCEDSLECDGKCGSLLESEGRLGSEKVIRGPETAGDHCRRSHQTLVKALCHLWYLWMVMKFVEALSLHL